MPGYLRWYRFAFGPGLTAAQLRAGPGMAGPDADRDEAPGCGQGPLRHRGRDNMMTAPGPAPPRPGRPARPDEIPRPRPAENGQPAAAPALPDPRPARRLRRPALAWLAGLASHRAARRATAPAGWLTAGALLFSC